MTRGTGSPLPRTTLFFYRSLSSPRHQTRERERERKEGPRERECGRARRLGNRDRRVAYARRRRSSTKYWYTKSRCHRGGWLGGCCHAVIRFPSHFERPLHPPRPSERSPVSFPLSSSRPPPPPPPPRRRRRPTSRERETPTGSRAMRASGRVPFAPPSRARPAADSTEWDERSAQRALSPCARPAVPLGSIERET